MSGKSISAWVDSATAKAVETVARLEDRPPAHIIAAAVKFYIALPEEARSAIRKIEAIGTPDEIRCARADVARALVQSQFEIAAEHAARQLDLEAVGPIDSEEQTEAAAVRLTRRPKRARVA